MIQFNSYALYDASNERFLNKHANTRGLRHSSSPRLWNAPGKCARALRELKALQPSAPRLGAPSFDDVRVIVMPSTGGVAMRYTAREFLDLNPKAQKRKATPWVYADGHSLGDYTVGKMYVVASGKGRYLKKARLIAASRTRLMFEVTGFGHKVVNYGRARLDVFPLGG